MGYKITLNMPVGKYLCISQNKAFKTVVWGCSKQMLTLLTNLSCISTFFVLTLAENSFLCSLNI